MKNHPLYLETEVTFTRGEGAFLFDSQGRRYFDGSSTLWTNLVGHGRKEIIEAMAQQLEKLSFMHLFSGTQHEPALALSQRLIETSPFKHRFCYFGLSGSDATETAMKLARAYWHAQGKPQKNLIVGRKSEYHGTSLGALSLMGHDEYQTPDTHRLPAPNCYRCPWGKKPKSCATECKNVFEEYFRTIDAEKNVAAILIEPIITSDGLIAPPPGYWEYIQGLCKRYQVLLISDEVSTGMGRTGSLYASTTYGLRPDIVYLAKSLTSGYAPLSAITVTHEIFDALHSEAEAKRRYFTHGSTFAGHPASCVAALKVLEIIFAEQLIDRAKILGEILKTELERNLSDIEEVGSIRGAGTLFELELVSNWNRKTPPAREAELGMLLYQKLLNKGQYLCSLGRFVSIAPPLISAEDEIKKMAASLREAILEVRERRELWK